MEDSLERLAAEVGVKPPGQAIAKLRYTHESMVDLIIANPAISQNDLAAAFGYTPSWICQILASDAFKVRLAARSAELVDPIVRLSVKERFESLVLRSLEILAEKLNKPPKDIPDNLAIRTLELASRGAGYGLQTPVAPQSTGDIHLHLEQMGSGLTMLLRKKKAEAIEGVSVEISP